MAAKKENFTIKRSEKRGPTEPAQRIDDFVSGQEPEVTKTFRIPARLGRAFKVHAAQTGQTEKDILIRLIEDYLANTEGEP